MEVHNDDARLDLYVQSLAWRLQTGGCPYRDTLRMLRAFRHLPLSQKEYVFKYGLKEKGTKHINTEKPNVTYCQWHLKPESGLDYEDDEQGQAAAEEQGEEGAKEH